jgi:hypothetical protein
MESIKEGKKMSNDDKRQEKKLTVRLRELIKYAITIMDEKGSSSEGDTAQMLSHEYWDKVRGALLQALGEEE